MSLFKRPAPLNRLLLAWRRAVAALRSRSEERYALVMAASEEGFWDWDVASDSFYASPRLLEICGFAPGTRFAGREDFLARFPFHPEDRLKWAQAAAEYFAGKSPRFDIEMRMLRHGETRWIHLTGIATRDASGALARWTGVTRDITERKAAEVALRESERRFRSLTRLSNDFYWETDAEHRYTMLDFGAVHRGEHKKWKKIGKRPWDIPYTSPDEAAWAAHRATIAARKPFVDFAMSRMDPGGERCYEISGEPRFDASGAFLGYHGVGRETTSRIRAERGLRHSEERYARAMLSANAGFWDWDVEKDDYYTSPRFIEMVGYPPGTTFAGREDFHYRTLYFPEDREKWRQGVRRLFAGSGSRLAMEVRVTVAGETRWHAMHGMCFRENGKVVRWTGYATDVTERKRAEEALRLSEERYARAIEGSDFGHWDCNLVTQEMFVSERARELLALPDGALPATWREMMVLVPMHPEDRSVMEERVAASIAAGTHEREYRVIPSPGVVRWVRTQGKVFRDASGAAVRLTGSIADITERKLAAEALAVSEARYARAMEASEAGHFEWDIATDEMFLSARMKVMLGFAPDTPFANRAEFVDKQNFLPGERQRLEEALRGSFVDPEGRYEIDYRIRLPSGEARWMRSQGKLFRDADGKPVRMAGSMTDVTERKRIEQESRGRQEMLEVAQKAARAVQWEWRNAAEPWSQRWSPELEAMFGLPPGAYDGTFAAWRKMVHPDDWTNVKSAIAHALATGEIDVEYRIVHPDGKVRWLNQKGRTFLGHDGKPVRSIGFMFDVTERKQAEEELRKLEQKLRRAQRLEAMGTLAGGIAHDFNNILHATLGYAEIAAGAAKQGTRLHHAVDSIVAAGERGRRLVDRILAFSRSGAGERVPVHVEEVVREALNQLAATLPENVTVASRLRAGRAAMLGDSTQVHQVVMNLANNAVHAMPHGGVLRVELEVERLVSERLASIGTIAAGEYVVLRVADTGTGIPPAVIEHMFDPFFTTKQIGVGSGLGLSLVHGIVTNLGGAIDVATELGTGSSFTVYLPRNGDAPARTTVKKRALPRGAGQRVLVVDDEEPLVRLAAETLKELGYAPVGFTSSTAALAAFRANPERFDAVLTDERMPGLSGGSLIREMRVIRGAIPVVLMSGYLGIDNVEADVVVRKPLSARELAASLARALQP